MSNDPGGLIRFIHAVLGLLTSTSVQGAVCLSVGGALTYVGILFGLPFSPLALVAPCRNGRPIVAIAGLLFARTNQRADHRHDAGPDRLGSTPLKQRDRWVEEELARHLA